MTKRLKSFLLLILFFADIFISSGFTFCTVQALDDENNPVKSFCSGVNITSALSNALEYAKKAASPENRITLKIAKGTYNVTKTLHLASYTVIDLNGARLKNANRKRGNIFKSPEDRAYPKYSSLRDCEIKNGTLDGNYNENRSCILRLCHGENIKLTSVNFLNNYYSHHCEIAACKNVYISRCVFSGQVSDLNISSSEAVQLDILDKVHFYGFTSYDNTMNDNITIDGCLFKNVYRGVGTHNYFRNLYQKNIVIKNCKFENITDCAVSLVNFECVLIENNRFLNCKYFSFSRKNGK